jgi:hypothetical protein
MVIVIIVVVMVHANRVSFVLGLEPDHGAHRPIEVFPSTQAHQHHSVPANQLRLFLLFFFKVLTVGPLLLPTVRRKVVVVVVVEGGWA